MKTTEAFKRTIEDYLKVRANTDELFAKAFQKEGKSIDECCNFILQTVKESGCNGFEDEEICCMAVHYYVEDEIFAIVTVDDDNGARDDINTILRALGLPRP